MTSYHTHTPRYRPMTRDTRGAVVSVPAIRNQIIEAARRWHHSGGKGLGTRAEVELGELVQYYERYIEHHRLRGQCAGLPECCIEHYVTTWLEIYETLTGEEYRLEITRAGNPHYIPCPECLRARLFVTPRKCAPGCMCAQHTTLDGDLAALRAENALDERCSADGWHAREFGGEG